MALDPETYPPHPPPETFPLAPQKLSAADLTLTPTTAEPAETQRCETITWCPAIQLVRNAPAINRSPSMIPISFLDSVRSNRLRAAPRRKRRYIAGYGRATDSFPKNEPKRSLPAQLHAWNGCAATCGSPSIDSVGKITARPAEKKRNPVRFFFALPRPARPESKNYNSMTALRSQGYAASCFFLTRRGG